MTLRSGWNMPPGCFRTPFDEPAYCAVCGNVDDACVCPECPHCSEHGNPECYKQGGHHKLTREQVIARQQARIVVLQDKLQDELWYLDQLQTTNDLPEYLEETLDPWG